MGFDRKCFSFLCLGPSYSISVASGCRNCIKNILGEWMFTANVMKLAIGQVIPSPACLVEIQIGEVQFVSLIFLPGSSLV